MPGRLATLDGWRAVAILLVLWCHFAMGRWDTALAYLNGSWAPYGAFGVDIFFAISGLLITSRLLDEQDRYGSISLRAFYIRRAFRILPPCFFYLAVLGIAVGFKTRLEVWSCFLFFRNYLPNEMGSWGAGHLWSLSIEEHFYLIWPGLFAWLAHKSRSTAATAASWLSIAFALWRIADANNHWTAGWIHVGENYRTDVRLDALFWGCTAAFALRDPKTRAQMSGRYLGWFFGVALVASVWFIIVNSPLSGVLLPILFPVLLLGTIANPQWMVSRALDSKGLVWIGKISYSLYLWQEIFLFPRWESPAAIQKFPWNLPLAFLCAWLSYRFLETPFIDWGRSIASRIVRVPLLQPGDLLGRGLIAGDGVGDAGSDGGAGVGGRGAEGELFGAARGGAAGS